MQITAEEIKSNTVRALTWREPFATLMLSGKINETRTWNTTVRGLVLICAGKSLYDRDSLREICGDKQLLRLPKREIYENDTLGYAIGVGRLVDCWRMQEADEDDAYVKYNPGLWVHRYSDVVAIKPILWAGVLGWRVLTEDQKKLIQPLQKHICHY